MLSVELRHLLSTKFLPVLGRHPVVEVDDLVDLLKGGAGHSCRICLRLLSQVRGPVVHGLLVVEDHQDHFRGTSHAKPLLQLHFGHLLLDVAMNRPDQCVPALLLGKKLVSIDPDALRLSQTS